MIVGASFAGLACATSLARGGARVVVVEKKSDPGGKLHTTGIIVKEAAEHSPMLADLPSRLVRKLSGVRLYAPNLRHIDLVSPNYYFLSTDTPELLRWLTGKAIGAGAQVRLESEFSGGARIPGGYSLDRIGETSYLVGADGPASRVAREMELGQNSRMLSGIEYEFEPFDFARPDLLHCFIDRRLAPGYICWVVNGVGLIQVGLAMRYRAGRTLAPKEALERFIEKISPIIPLRARPPVSVRAGRIPCGGLVAPLSAERTLLVGDAAGMVSPVTAGGIHTALKHGWAAGEAIAEFLAGSVPDPASWFVSSYPRFRAKRALRFLYDHFQSDSAFNLLLGTRLMRAAAELVYFHHQGVFRSRH